jgi:CRISPR-associated protein Cpf1
VFIDDSLKGFVLTDLIDYENFYVKKDKDDNDKKNFEKVKAVLRKQISDTFKGQEKFKSLFAKELIKEVLLSFVKDDEKALVNEFKDFTTYFTGFHENRKNMYVADEKATSIAFRLINENLPKFIDNLNIFHQIQGQQNNLTEEFKKALIEMEEMTQGIELEEVFSLNYFNETLTQRGIELYNTIIGGRTENDGTEKKKGLNECINLYNQQQKDRKNRLPKFKQLYKQILSDRNSSSFVIDQFENDTQLLESIEQFYQAGLCNYETDGNTINIITTLKNFLSSLNSFNLSQIYLKNDRSITDISQSIFDDWSVIKSALADYYEITFPIKDREKTERFAERKEKWLSKNSYFDIQTIQTALAGYDNENIKDKNKPGSLVNYFDSMGLNTETKLNLLDKVSNNYAAIKDLLNSPYPEDEKLGNNKNYVGQIKLFLDSLMNLLHFIKPLKVNEEGLVKDERFYSVYEQLYDQLDQVVPLYNKIRNYLTQKPYSIEKIKLNFENPALLNGWPVNNEIANSCIILKKDGKDFLGVLDKSSKKGFKPIKNCSEQSSYLKMFYNQTADPSKDVQNLMIIDGKTEKKNGRKDEDGINRRLENLKNTYLHSDINKIRKLKSYLKSSISFNKDDLTAFIDYYKERTIDYYKSFQFNFKPSNAYSDFQDFTNHINSQAYQIYFKPVDSSYVDKLVNEGKLYLFQIYNKDFSPFSKGTPNMHTLYWRMLFDENNLADTVYKLNGEAEVFFRKSSIKAKNLIVHKAGEAIKSKNELNIKRESTFDYDIIKDRRFTLDKFQFHVPVTMNFKSVGSENINQNVNRFLQNNPEVKIIGLDRGERHLIYLTLINQKGEILKQESLNLIGNEKQQINYKELLQKKEGERTEARKDWKTIENIKEIKEGYLSQVVHKIATMMVEENAIVVMEDLNQGFMRGRQKVERQVYQKLEKMLIDKLNYLVFKTKVANEPGGLLKALQLTSKFDSFKNMGKQSGFLFYVPAWNTSKIDPATGFVDFLKPKYENIEKAKAFFKKFEVIRFNADKNYFEFRFDYNEFTTKAEGTQTKWTVCTQGKERYAWNRKLNNGKGTVETIDVTQSLQLLFGEVGIAYASGSDLITDIINQESADFFKKIMRLLAITLSLRHSNGKNGNEEKDFILSPVFNNNGVFFNSLVADEIMPKDADANGAFHIALKGLWALRQINTAEDLKKIKLAISNKEWLQFVQTKPYQQ